MGLSRRAFLGTLAVLPSAAERALSAQPGPLPIIDSHIHIFDKSRPEGSFYPCDTSLLGRNYQRLLPAEYRAVAQPFGVVGAIVVESQMTFRVEANQWVLDHAAQPR